MPTASEEKRADTGAPAVSGAGSGNALLNLGCGKDVHSAFVNVDLIPAPGVVVHDLRRGIPFPEGTFDLVYHATMLSHLRPADALKLTGECYRVLKPGGVLRVVTEDLETMCRIYLQKLEEAFNGNSESAHDYDWMMLEIYDQATRETPGGGMLEYLKQDPLPNEAFVISRMGAQGERMITNVKSFRSRAKAVSGPSGIRPFLSRIKAGVQSRLLAAVFGSDVPRALDVGQFRVSSGTVSYCMYDRFSLRRLFSKAGFTNMALRTPYESGYRSWREVNLDLDTNGTPARPHTLIMEGIRPSGGSA
jgi:SAM-dependent methyltransferase